MDDWYRYGDTPRRSHWKSQHGDVTYHIDNRCNGDVFVQPIFHY